MIDEGYIKFDCLWSKTGPLKNVDLRQLNKWREGLYELDLIGAYDNGIGYGNISELHPAKQFVISGSATGNLPQLDANYYSKVIDYDIDLNKVTCEGPLKASSESLTHASIYENDPDVKGVIHVHSMWLWEKLKNKVPTTRKEIPYGTPEMAKEITRLFLETDVKQQGIIVMAGHEEGIITFGKNLDDAGAVLMKYVGQNQM